MEGEGRTEELMEGGRSAGGRDAAAAELRPLCQTAGKKKISLDVSYVMDPFKYEYGDSAAETLSFFFLVYITYYQPKHRGVCSTFPLTERQFSPTIITKCTFLGDRLDHNLIIANPL